MGPLLLPVQVLLNAFPSFQGTDCTTQLGVLCKLDEGALDAVVCVTDKDVEEHWSQDGSLGDIAHDLLPSGHRTIDHNPLAMAILSMPYPSNNSAFKSMPLQIRDKDVVQDHVKGLAEVQVALSLSTKAVTATQKTSVHSAGAGNLAQVWRWLRVNCSHSHSTLFLQATNLGLHLS